jgi:hypothetical protein
MPPEEAPADEPQILEGPDPRSWPGMDEIWGPVSDLRAIDAVYELLDGKVAMDGMSAAYEEARRLVRAFRAETCEQLALALLTTYNVQPGDDAGASPFSRAGKPRAFGADSPPAGNLPGWRRPTPGKAMPRTDGGRSVRGIALSWTDDPRIAARASSHGGHLR